MISIRRILRVLASLAFEGGVCCALNSKVSDLFVIPMKLEFWWHGRSYLAQGGERVSNSPSRPWHVNQHSEDLLASLVLKTRHLLLLNLVPRKTRHALLLPPPLQMVPQVQVVCWYGRNCNSIPCSKSVADTSFHKISQSRSVANDHSLSRSKTMFVIQMLNHSAPALVLVLSQVLVHLVGERITAAA